MQLASLLDRELQSRNERRTIWQKGKQVIGAWEIEKGWSKQKHFWKPTSTSLPSEENFKGSLLLEGAVWERTSRAGSIRISHPGLLDPIPNASSSELIKRVSHLNKMMDWKIGEEEIHSKVRQIFLGPNLPPSPRESCTPYC